MPKMNPEILAKYEQLMRKDPLSKAFAPLADAYLEENQIDRAEYVVRDGLRKHPDYAPGLIVYAKILKSKKQFQMALELLKKAAQKDSENILAHQLMGDIYLELKKTQEALKSYKMVLFLNPLAPKAKKMIQKLESLSASEFDESTFQMTKLTSLEELKKNRPIETEMAQKKAQLLPENSIEGQRLQEKIKNSGLLRMLSLIDAFLSRHDLIRAHELIEEALFEFGPDPELTKRAHFVSNRGLSSQLSSPHPDKAAPLRPLQSRERLIREKKIHQLQKLLRKIEDARL